MRSYNMNDHQEYMRHALIHAQTALDAGEFPVGCVLVSAGKIIAAGRRINSRDDDANELDHAEIISLRNLFTHNPQIDRSTITAYSTMEPCLMCYASLLLNGIRTIVYGYEDIMGGGTSLDLSQLPVLYNEMQATIIPHVLRQESLTLFKAFFSKPENQYWQGSPLARYTLQQ